MKRPTFTSLLAVAFSVVVAGQAASAQTGAWYLTNGDLQTNFVVQGGGVTGSASQVGDEYAVAVLNGSVRTLANGNCANASCTGQLGAEYTLGLVPTGNTFAYSPSSGACFYDGTTDGTSNYAADYCNGGVYQMNTDWSNATLLFGTSVGTLGITYDPTSNTLFTSIYETNQVFEYSMTGSLLNSFDASWGENRALAMDYSDGTLWSWDGNGTANQFTTSGTWLSSESLDVGNVLGGEFEFAAANVSTTPEPASLTLLATGLVALLPATRRRKR